MRLLLVGYGKMGRMVEELAAGEGFEIVGRVDEGREEWTDADVAIDFSTADALLANFQQYTTRRLSAVIGTTGWNAHLDRLRDEAGQAGIGIVASGNFSIGVNVFARVVAEAARLLATEPEYGAWAWEIHHATKKDAPSGTLLKLVEEMKSAGYARAIDVSSNRAGAHPGTHEIGFDSAGDTITLRHIARGREGFARGALKAAHWVVGKKGFHEFREILFT